MFKRLASLVGLGAETLVSGAENLVGVPLHEYNIKKMEEATNEAQNLLDQAEAKQNLNKKKFEEYERELSLYETALLKAKGQYEQAMSDGDEALANSILEKANAAGAKRDSLVAKNKMMVQQYEMAMEGIARNREIINSNKAGIEAEREMMELVRSNDAALKAHKQNEKIMDSISGMNTGGGSSALSKMQQKQELEFETMKVSQDRKKQEAAQETSALDALNDVTSGGEKKMPW
ncbi:hypothetical protein OTK49_02395 [Vibrio coralliirubri]|uniref:PspA/IM30 family protein n=1 Tax=Vibrio coralliirubri TaxID=1516159 RepID=UPI0022851FFF|nr:hypothetical protein [Vibrio coralliirubri]MCY9861366.1 hypothetical protein [Vibrio coralliirubri]